MAFPRITRYAPLAAILFAAACQDTATTALEPAEANFETQGDMSLASVDVAAAFSAQMDAVNAFLEAEGADYRALMVEYIGHGDEVGATVIQKDVGNKHLSFDFVPGDTRRGWSGGLGDGTDDITYAIDQVDATPFSPGVTGAQTTAAIVSSMDTWDAEQCSDLPLTRVPDFGLDLGYVAFLNGLGGGPFVVADVMHAGFRDINFAGGVLAATFTFGFTSGGVFTDIDGNGRADTAFREIYYDPSWFWAVDGTPNRVDVESIALHEAGHALSQAHFGNIFIKKGQFSASPRAVMNAFYPGGQQHALLGTDTGGHCSNWANWPNN